MEYKDILSERGDMDDRPVIWCSVITTAGMVSSVEGDKKMQCLLILILYCSLILSDTVFARDVEIDVHGMTCAFCVDSLERKFSKMKSVSTVQISLTKKKVRLQTDDEAPSIETIKQTVLDAGFTPVKVSILPSE